MQALLSTREIDKLTVLKRVEAKRLTQRETVGILGISERHVRRLLRTFRSDGAAGLASKRRGRPSNRRIEPFTQKDALDLLRERYADYGPTLAQEKLSEHQGIERLFATLNDCSWALGASRAPQKAASVEHIKPASESLYKRTEALTIGSRDRIASSSTSPTLCSRISRIDSSTVSFIPLSG